MNSFTQILLVAAGLAAQAQAHSYMILPEGRLSEKYGFGSSLEDGSGNRMGLCNLGGGKPTCCTSDVMKKQTTYKRGEEIESKWWRNNHQGGFIRYSIVPQDESDSQDAFDANVLSFQCSQVGCDATYDGSGPNNFDGADKNGFMEWSNICSGNFKIPYHLKDGGYTIQWVWFGQGDNNKGPMTANSPFQGCIDLQIKGGEMGEKPACPMWKGGDLSESGDNVCAYVAVDKPTLQGVCLDSNQCSGRPAVGIPAGLDQCVAGKAPKSWPLGMVESAKGAPDSYTNYSVSGSAPSSSADKEYATSDDSTSTPSGQDDSSSESVSSSTSADTASYEAPKSKKKCSNKKRSMLVKGSSKRHRRRASSEGGRAMRHGRRKASVAL